MTAELTAFAIALVASLALMVPVRQLALRLGMVDLPGPRKIHLTPIPVLGGLAIYCAVLLAVFVALDGGARTQMIGVLTGATLLATVGILDDRGLLHHQIKLFLGMPLAGVILLISGIRANAFSPAFPGTVGTLLDGFLTVLWVVGITAAFSILDHMDGLCAGVAAMASAYFLLFAVLSGQVLVSTMAAAVLGAAAGFLRWNFNPAKIFMGDGGAMFLGFMMATLGLKLRPAGLAPEVSWMMPVLVLGVPVLDTTLITVSRLRRGFLPFTTPGKDHAAHRLSNLGLGPRGAVLALYAVGGVSGTLAWLASRLTSSQAYLLFFLWMAAILMAVAAMEHAPYERQQKPSAKS